MKHYRITHLTVCSPDNGQLAQDHLPEPIITNDLHAARHMLSLLWADRLKVPEVDIQLTYTTVKL